ncbi:hypothetical protein [Intestinibacter sp.]|uniref:hypothetical protein n=1 Tax=Intestinibacter sp. TaxID=1965304 RepID=UPI002A74C9BB|nr:hypothetical protein [Intestinibacter sp.]MDY2736233.1 hypothetical protein [Intestinibacter sp.]
MPENETLDLESAAKIIARQGERIIELENKLKDYDKNKKIVDSLREIIKELTPTDQSNS